MNLHHIPAVPYHLIVRQYAIANGLRFWKWSEVIEARKQYEEEMKKLN